MARPRKPRAMKWNVFVGRRGIDVEVWLTHLKLKSYDSLVLWCKNANVVPPEKAETKGWFSPRKKVVAPVIHATQAIPAPKTPKKKTVAPKKTLKEAPKNKV